MEDNTVEWLQDGEEVMLKLKDTGEPLTFKSWFANNFNPVDTIQFADGTTLTAAQVCSSIVKCATPLANSLR